MIFAVRLRRSCKKAMRGRIALQKHFVRNSQGNVLLVSSGSSGFGSACASSRRFASC